jgi:flagellar motor switch protein FliG
MKKLNVTTYLAIRDIPVEELFPLLEFLSDTSSAVIFMNLESSDSYNLMTMLPQKKRDRIVQCLIDLEGAEERLLQQVLVKVEKEIATVLSTRYDTVDIKDRLVEFICRLKSSQRVAVLEVIKDKKKAFYNKLHKKIMEYKEKNNIFFFEDILSFRDEELRDNIQKKMDIREIAMAVKGADEAIANKIMKNLSKRVQEMVMDDLQYLESATREQIDEAQNEIMMALMKKKK